MTKCLEPCTMGEHDLAGAILEAPLQRQTLMSIPLSEKLYEISAENFGKRVHEFYLDAIISNNFQKDLAKV